MWNFAGGRIANRLSSLLTGAKITAALFAAILCVISFSQNTYAADAKWENDSIIYDNKKYDGPMIAQDNSEIGLPKGATYFENKSSGKSKIIYFDKDVDLESAEGAKFQEYKFSPPDTYTKISDEKNISLDKKSDSAGGSSSKKENATSCAVNGIGYILCPIMGFLADAMDKFFDFIQYFLYMKPISNNKESSLYRAWQYVQAIANVCFVIMFLYIIYAYVTNREMATKGVWMIFPRLIIAAIVVNVSFFICAVLIDLSNIVGASLQDMLIALRDQLIATQSTTNKLDGLTWGSATAYILSGGTIAASGLMSIATYGPGVVYLLVPVLVTAIIAFIVTLAVLAARQALIIVLVIISPLAFVCYILPGTQKYFDKWKDMFQTMLMLYPIFSLLFGGSQLAGYLIAQNASRIEVVILAMFVQAAPLIITPFLIKFSGSLLGKVAGIVNDPSKGFADKAKNFSNRKADLNRARRMANNSFGTGAARYFDGNRRKDEARAKRYEARRQKNFNLSNTGRAIAIEQMREEARLQASENSNRAAYEEMKINDPGLRRESIQNKVAEMNLNTRTAEFQTYLEELKTKKGAILHGQNNPEIASWSRRMQELSEEDKVQSFRQTFAKDELNADFQKKLLDNQMNVQVRAGGVKGDDGKMLAVANAVVETRADFIKNSKAVAEVMDHIRMSGEDIAKLAYDEQDVDVKGYHFDANNSYVLDAATGKYMDNKANFVMKYNLLKNKSGKDKYAEVRSTLTEGVQKTMLKEAPFLGGKWLDVLNTTGFRDEEHIYESVRDYIMKGKAKQDIIADMGSDGLEIMLKAIQDGNIHDGIDPSKHSDYDENRAKFINMVNETMNNDRLKSRIAENAKPVLEKIGNLK